MPDAQLKVDVAGSLTALALAVDAANVDTAGSLPVADYDARTQLAAILSALAGTLTVDTDVSSLATESSLQSLIAASGTASLAGRMLAKSPADGYTLWLDTADADHIYTLEASTGTAASATGFRGIRITLDASGNPVGAVEVNESATLAFDNRTTDPGWAS